MFSIVTFETASQTRTNVGRDVIFFMGNWLDSCVLLLVDLMWVTGCPAFMPGNTSDFTQISLSIIID